MSGGSERNVWGSGTQDLFGLSNGIYEEYENSYSKEIITESKENKEVHFEEQILQNNDDIKKLLKSLEIKDAGKKDGKE